MSNKNKESENWCVNYMFKDGSFEIDFIIDSFLKKEGFGCDSYDIFYSHYIEDEEIYFQEDEVEFSINEAEIRIGIYKIKNFVKALIEYTKKNKIYYKKDQLEDYYNSL